MLGISETETHLLSPLAARPVQSQTISLEEAQRDALQVYYGSLNKQTLIAALVTLCFLFIMGYTAVSARAGATKYKVGGAAVLAVCAGGLAFVIYEYRRKQRVFILKDSFAVERRFSFDVELIRWADIAKLYALDRVTETKVSVYFIPVAKSKSHEGKLRIVLVDGCEIILTNRFRDFSNMATQFVLRTHASQLVPCTNFVNEGGALDFDKFGLSREGLIYKRQLHGWDEIDRLNIDARGTLSFKSPKLWLAPRFNTSALPNAALLHSLLTVFWGDLCET